MKFSFCLAFLGVASALHLRPNKPSEQTPQRRAAVTTAAPIAKPEPIFYMTAMNKLASKHQTRLWLSSVRQAGKWKGQIVIVTDKPECLEKNLGKELLGGAKVNTDNAVMNVYPGGEGMGKVYFLKVGATGNVKAMKSQKAQAWNNMRKLSLKPSFIVYTDQDIVFGDDVNRVVEDAKINLLQKGHTMALFIDQGVTKGQLHTGIILMFPGEATETCLADWGSKILTTSSTKYKGFDRQTEDMELSEAEGEKVEAESAGPDQRALGKTGSCKAGAGIAILPAHLLMMPTKGKLSNGQKATFIHFTNTNRWKSINNDVMANYFKSTLALPEQEWFAYETC